MPWLGAVLPGLVLIAVGLVGFLGILDSVHEEDDLMTVDTPVLTWLVENRNDLVTDVLHAITLVSGPVALPIIIVVAVVAWGLRSGRWGRPLLLAGAMVTASLVSLAIKRGVARPRPPVESQYIPGAETTFSFPSGHTIATATLCLVAGYLVWSRHPSLRVLALVLSATFVITGLVGLSRLYLGYHFVTDVLAAVALAVAILGVVVATDRLRAFRRNAPPPPVGPVRP